MTAKEYLDKEAGTSILFNNEDMPGHYALEGKYGRNMLTGTDAGKHRKDFVSLGRKLKYQGKNEYDSKSANDFLKARRAYARELLDDMNAGGDMIDRHMDANITKPRKQTIISNNEKKTLIGKIFGIDSTYTTRTKKNVSKAPDEKTISSFKKDLGLAANFSPKVNSNINLLSFG